ncbi:S8 family serine peptidase [Nonomuraea sp. SMC257]|uniref:S8 family serine peptidase n=1 Tax=Nonomuraea montanisoli TaxID=2741721 RepID=A0A7Y6M7G2_9ACTN|nr:S8 family serine peptidase [Nonomuraea montanisoli]NUW37412.1 S8 family serine peptidase [Nonomuraea montanisoli]
MRLGKGLVAAVLAGSAGVTAAQAPAAATPATSPTPATSIAATPATPATSPTPAAAAADRPVNERTGTVTLITGDKVVVTAAGHRVEPGPGRQASYASQRRDGHLYVYPSDARPLVAQGVLDERLFDVTQLLEWEYGDAQRGDIPLITQSAQGDVPALRSARQTRRMSALGMAAVQVPKANAAETWKSLASGARTLSAGRTKLWLDGRRPFTLDRSVKQIGATEAWKQGFTGKGVTVAVLDSGYDPDHPDLKDVVTQSRNFSEEPDIRDNLGHGTHVASIVAGAGEKYRGVAPDAKIALGKVGGVRGPADSAILAGMEWAALEVKAKVVNLSIGAPDTPELDPLEQAVATLSERTGVLFVIAAGNDGLPGTVNSPGSADAALTVGAVDRDDRMAPFSSAGPRSGDHAIKPDLTAPGVEITAAAAAGTADGPYVAHSGTSMAAPHVAGAAAILAQRHPDWSGQRLKAALIGSAAPQEGATPYQEGAGRVDLVRTLAQQVTAATPNVWAAFPWDGTGERVVTKDITYANAGDTPVTLDLGEDSEVLELGAQSLVVPAKGEASVKLTIRGEGRAPGDYPGVVTARSGDTVIRTLAGAYVEPESYNLTVKTVDPEGNPPDVRVSGEAYDKTGDRRLLAFDGQGKATVRLPKGEWNLYVDLWGGYAAFGHRSVTIDSADRELTFDVREAKKVEFTVDEPTAERDRLIAFTLANGAWNTAWISFGQSRGYYVFPVRQPGLRYMSTTVWHKKDAKPSPYRYDLVDYEVGGIPDDPTYRARTRELVKVSAAYRAPGGAAKARTSVGPQFPGAPWTDVWISSSPETDLPATMTHYRTPGFAWTTQIETGTHTVAGHSEVLGRRPVAEVWNDAVTGPAFGTPAGDRDGDRLRFTADGLLTAGRAGLNGGDSTTTGKLALTRGAEALAEADLAGCVPMEPEKCLLKARLPAEAATYTLTASAQRPSALSTKVEAAWTFRSERTDKARPLPLTAVRYLPEGLDDHNRAKPGSTTVIPVSLQRNPGAPAARATSITVETSFDDGASWRPVRLVRSGSGWTARVANPAAPGFVSLRAKVTDAAGDQVTQTITRAYAIG